MQRMDLRFHGDQSFQATLKELGWIRGHGMHLCEMCCVPVAQQTIPAHFNMPIQCIAAFLHDFFTLLKLRHTKR